MAEDFFVESVREKRFRVFASLDKIPNIRKSGINIENNVKRGDGILIDVMEKGKNTGKKQLVIVAGFTYEPKTYPSILMWYGDPNYIAKLRKFVVLGQFYTEDSAKEIIKIEMPERF